MKRIAAFKAGKILVGRGWQEYFPGGYRLEFRDWWFNVRPSNTEPYLRFIAEAATESMLNSILEETEKILGRFGEKEV